MAQQTYDLGPVCPIYKGDWSAKATYETLNMVRHGTALWVMTAKTYTVGSTPSDSSAFWKKAAQDGTAGAKGDKGDTGDTGAKGATGAKGVSFVVKGAWASGTDYVNNAAQIDVVAYNGSSYACKKSHTSSSSILPTNATYWTLIAQKGATGATGKQGEKGEKGDKGDTGATGAQGPQGPAGSTSYAAHSAEATPNISINYNSFTTLPQGGTWRLIESDGDGFLKIKGEYAGGTKLGYSKYMYVRIA